MTEGLLERAGRVIAESAVSDASITSAAKVHLLDSIGLAISSRADKRVGAARAAMGADQAFVMSIACSMLGLDDFDEATRAHPGAVLVPALLAAAAASPTPVAGADLIAALVAGYRVFSGLGSVAGASTLHLRGFHPSSFLGAPAGAAAIARLRSAPAQTCSDAIGIAASLASGITEFDAKETMRAVQTAWAASSAVRAYALATSGIHASAHAIDASGGLVGRLGEVPGGAELVGDEAAITRVSFKPYPHFSDLHPATGALIELLRVHRPAPADVRGVRVHLTEASASRLSMEFPPTSAKQAKRSTRFVVASVILASHRSGDGGKLLDSFGEAALDDPEVLALGERVELVADRSPGEPALVVVDLDGTTVSATALGYPGDGRDPMLRWGWANSVVRFRQLTAQAVGSTEIESAIAHLEQLGDVRVLARRVHAIIGIQES
ncbi:MAG: MmgE/PrpD family protein [Glaciihabitans sp.]|nr:MmgE/PrpD family protein [Glaciihabitans sp.]